MKRYLSILKKTASLLYDEKDPIIQHHIRQVQAHILSVLALKGYPIDFDSEAHFEEYTVPVQYLKEALGYNFPVIYDLNKRRMELNLIDDTHIAQTDSIPSKPETIEESMERILKSSGLSSSFSPSDPKSDTNRSDHAEDQNLLHADEDTNVNEKAEEVIDETKNDDTTNIENERTSKDTVDENEEEPEEIAEDTDDEVEEVEEVEEVDESEDDEFEQEEESKQSTMQNADDPYENITTMTIEKKEDTGEKEEETEDDNEELDLIDEDESDDNPEETDENSTETGWAEVQEVDENKKTSKQKVEKQLITLAQLFGSSQYEPAPVRNVQTDLVYGKDFIGVPPSNKESIKTIPITTMPVKEKEPEEEPEEEPEVEPEEELEKTYEFKPYLHKNDLTFFYDYVTVTTGGRKEVAELIIYPLHKDGSDIIVWCLFNGKTSVRYSGEKSQVLVPLLNTRLIVSGQFVDHEFFTQVRLPKKDKARGDTIEVDEDFRNGKEGHVASYDDENNIEVHVFPTTFKNNQTKNADYFYYVKMDDEKIYTGDTNDNPFVYVQTDSHNLEVVARWDETKDLIGVYVQDNI